MSKISDAKHPPAILGGQAEKDFNEWSRGPPFSPAIGGSGTLPFSAFSTTWPCALGRYPVWMSRTLILKTTRLRCLGKVMYQKAILSLPKPTAIALKSWLAVRSSNRGPLFVGCTIRGKKKTKRLSPISIYKVVRSIGERVGVRTRPHGLRHTAISEAVRLVQQNGMDLTSILKFSRHSNMTTLQFYLDQESRLQGKIADLVAAASE